MSEGIRRFQGDPPPPMICKHGQLWSQCISCGNEPRASCGCTMSQKLLGDGCAICNPRESREGGG